MYKRYTKEFKNEIIQRFLKRETVINISYETKIPRTTLYRWISDYQKENRFPKKFINNTIDELQNRIEKLETLLKIINEVGVSPQAPLKEKLNAMAPFYQKYKDKYHCVYQTDIYTKEQWFEIMPMEASKSNAIKQLQGMLDCEKLIVFGDGKNDIDMFLIADESYAVANAHEELKKYATAVILSNDEDGVARWLEGNYT